MILTLNELVFYFCSFIAVASAISVVTAKNPVQAVLFLVLTFFSMAANWMLLEAEFLAITLVLVYVGAVMVLFLFVVMMIDIEQAGLKKAFVRFWPISILVSFLFIGLMWYVLSHSLSLEAFSTPSPKPADYSHVKVVAKLMFSDFLLPFEIAGVILLVAMIAAIGLTFRGAQTPKTQRIGEQVQVRKADRLQVIKMSAQERKS